MANAPLLLFEGKGRGFGGGMFTSADLFVVDVAGATYGAAVVRSRFPLALVGG